MNGILQRIKLLEKLVSGLNRWLADLKSALHLSDVTSVLGQVSEKTDCDCLCVNDYD